MSLWFDKKNKEYAFDGRTGWLKNYIERLVSGLSDRLSAEELSREMGDSSLTDSHTAHITNGENPHNVTKEQLGLSYVDNTSDMNKPVSAPVQVALYSKADCYNSKKGFVGGYAAEADGGSAVGENAYAGDGFSGGRDARVSKVEDVAIDAIQLGAGVNEKAKTLQIYNYTLLDEDGVIPPMRMAAAGNNILGKNAVVLGAASSVVYAPNSAIVAGLNNETVGDNSFVGGGSGNAACSQNSAIVGGASNSASGENSFIGGGKKCVALANGVAFGHYNNCDNLTPGQDNGTEGCAMIIGNGTASARANAFRVDYNGEVYGTGAFHTTGADLAHVFEWADGNTEKEDRRGYFVAFQDGKVRIANSSDQRILGVVSDNASFVANDYTENWQGMYLKDVYGGYITEKSTVTEIDPKTGEEVEYEIENRVINPEYDPERPYVPRSQRDEYAIVGHNGILVVNDDGSCTADGYCTVTDEGAATKSIEKTPYYVIKRLDDSHIQIFI